MLSTGQSPNFGMPIAECAGAVIIIDPISTTTKSYTKDHFMRICGKLCVGLLALCALAAIAATTSVARAQEPLRWKFKVGDKLDYDTAQNMEINVTGTPQGDIKMTTDQQMDLKWEVVEVNDQGEAKVQQKVDRIQMKMSAPMGQGFEYDSQAKEPPVGSAAMAASMFQPMTKGTFEFTITPRGEVKDVKVPEEVLAVIKNTPQAAQMGDLATPEGIQKMMMQEMMVLPEKAPAAGETWSTKTEVAIPVVGKQTVETTYTFTGMKEVEGKQYAAIQAQRKMNFAKTENQQMQLNMKDQSSDGEVLFNVSEGRLGTSTLNQNITMEAMVAGQTIVQKMDQKSSVTVKPTGSEPEETEAADSSAKSTETEKQ